MTTIFALQIRLRHLPADLDEFFSKILDTIEDIYQEQTAQNFSKVRREAEGRETRPGKRFETQHPA